MNILMLSQAYPRFRGDLAGAFIESMAKSIAARGHTVHLVIPAHPLLDRAPVEEGVHLHPFRYAPVRSWSEWGYAQSMRGDVRLKRKLYLLAPIVFLSARAAMSRVAAQTHPDVIHAHWLLPNGPIAAGVARRRKRPLVISLHGSDIYLAERNPAFAYLARAALRVSSAVTAPSDDLLARARKLGAEDAQTELLLYGADTDRFDPGIDGGTVRQQFLLEPGDVMVLGVGRFVYKKGFRYLIQALESAPPNTHLVLVGDGDLRGELQTEARTRGLEARVHFAGWVPHTEMPRFFAACDIFVLPSVRDEAGNVDGLPNTALEAMSAGRAVVASRIAGVPQVIADQVTGLLVSEQDASMLGAAITRLACDPAQRARLGAAARARVEADLTWGRVAERLEAIYERAAGNRGMGR